MSQQSQKSVDGTWDQYQRLVLYLLDQNADWCAIQDKKLAELEKQVELLKYKATLISAVAGTFVVFLAKYLEKVL